MAHGFVPHCLFCHIDVDGEYCRSCGSLATSVYTDDDLFCLECLTKQLHPRETYTVSDHRVGTYVFDVCQAVEICVSEDAPVKVVPEDVVLQFLHINITDPQHYAHIASSEPGIVAHIEIGEDWETFALLDGSHGAGRAVVARQPFSAYAMNWEQAKRCLLCCTPGRLVTDSATV